MTSRIIQGLFVGYAATAVMDTSQTTVIPALSSMVDRYLGSQHHPPQAESSDGGETQESSPTKVARKAAGVLGIKLTHDRAEKWGNRVHWAYGTAWGVAYTLFSPEPGFRSGLLYGAGLWLGSDEMLLWGLGISKAPSNYPPKSHIQALAAHLLFGATVGLLGRGIRR